MNAAERHARIVANRRLSAREDLKRVAFEAGRGAGWGPTESEYTKGGRHGKSKLRHLLGLQAEAKGQKPAPWTHVLRAAGLRPSRERLAFDHTELRQDCVLVATRLGRWPSMQEYTRLGRFHARTITHSLGSWARLGWSLGFRPHPKGGSRASGIMAVTDAEAIRALRDTLLKAGYKLGDTIPGRYSFVSRKGRPAKYPLPLSGETYARRFGSWAAAVRAAGFEPCNAPIPVGLTKRAVAA